MTVSGQALDGGVQHRSNTRGGEAMTRRLATAGLWALPAGGVVTLIPWVADLLLESPDPVNQADGYARWLVGVGQIWGAFAVAGPLLILFGILALGVSLAGTRGGAWAALGAIAGVIAMVVVFGVSLLIWVGGAIVADTALAGHQGAAATFRWMSGGNWNGRVLPLLAVLIVTGIGGVSGLGVGLWRSDRHPRWLAVGFALAILLEVVSAPIVTLVGAVLLVLTGLLIAREGGAAGPST